ncbi:MAG: ATP-dependent zinc metalloprotease FtsH, partial [Deinococcus sp.]
ISDADRRVTAYHEVGHALAAQLLPHADRVHKLTVVPRGRALGVAMYTPRDRMHHTREALLDRICVALAGQAAEEVALGTISTGAQSDFQTATSLGRRMITEWGMSSLGTLALSNEQGGYLGLPPEYGQYSEHTAQRIDEALLELMDTQFQRAKGLLTEHLHVVHRLVDALVLRETLSLEEFEIVMAGGTLPELPAEPASQGGPQGREGGDAPGLGTLSPGPA